MQDRMRTRDCMWICVDQLPLLTLSSSVELFDRRNTGIGSWSLKEERSLVLALFFKEERSLVEARQLNALDRREPSQDSSHAPSPVLLVNWRLAALRILIVDVPIELRRPARFLTA